MGHTCWAERTYSCVLHICPPQISPVKLPEMEPQEPLFPKSEVSTSYPASYLFTQLARAASGRGSVSPVWKRVCIGMPSPWIPLQNSTLCYFIHTDPHLIRLEGHSIHQGAKPTSRGNLYTIPRPPNCSGPLVVHRPHECGLLKF